MGGDILCILNNEPFLFISRAIEGFFVGDIMENPCRLIQCLENSGCVGILGGSEIMPSIKWMLQFSFGSF